MNRLRDLSSVGMLDDYSETPTGVSRNAWHTENTNVTNSPVARPHEEQRVELSERQSKDDAACCPHCRRREHLNNANICTYCLMHKKNPFIEQYLHMQLLSKYTRNALEWSGICALIFVMLLLHMWLAGPCTVNPWLYGLELKLCKASFVGIFLCLALYYLIMRRIRIKDIRKEQKTLLGIFDDDNQENEGVNKVADGDGFASKLAHRSCDNRSCVCLICKSLESARGNEKLRDISNSNWSPTRLPSSVRDTSGGLPLHVSNNITPRVLSYGNVSPPQQLRRSYDQSHNRSGRSNNSSMRSPYASPNDDLITNKRDLKKYLEKTRKKYDEMNMLNSSYISDNGINAWNPFVSFWRYFTKPSTFVVPAYQFSPLPVSTPVNSNSICGAKGKLIPQSFLLKGITTDSLVQYVAKLRRWLSSTILERVSMKIKAANKVFAECGLADVEIGSVGLERLRKIVENREFVNRYMPDLPILYRFLNFCPNQSYYVQRIEELANGSCLADYNWNNANGMQSISQLPSDAAILFHMFCVYIDSQLMPMPQGGSERPFHSQYVIVDDGKLSTNDLIKCVKNRAQCAIICNDMLRPKFSFICKNEIQNCVTDFNNLFLVIIQFLLYMRNHKGGMLESVSLGIQGINILSVIEDK